MSLNHEKQRELWEEEHHKPFVFLQIGHQDASSGVKRFFSWFSAKNLSLNSIDIEMECGK
ncbi:MAG TPA: hypothetical protein VJI32_03105 [Candidatus Nanoarchaeia archaeon]|nr:hypothetical protein [Candidatus Nanoarchaeia archaeon]